MKNDRVVLAVTIGSRLLREELGIGDNLNAKVAARCHALAPKALIDRLLLAWAVSIDSTWSTTKGAPPSL